MKNTNKLISAFILLVSVILIQSCASTTKVYSDFVKGTDFSKYKTYAWLPSNIDTTSRSVLNNEIVRENIRQRVNYELEQRGYVLDTLKPDLLVLIHTMYEERKDMVRTPLYSTYDYWFPGFYSDVWHPYYYGYYYNVPRVMGYDIRQVQYTEGTLVIDLIDREKNGLVWRGWAEKIIDNPKEYQKTLGTKVGKIFEKYPVKSKASESYP